MIYEPSQDDYDNMTDVEKYSEVLFERYKHVNEYNQEFWYSRELQDVLEYSQWRYFYGVISKAIEACESAVYLLKTILPKSAKWYLWEVVLSVRLRISCSPVMPAISL